MRVYSNKVEDLSSLLRTTEQSINGYIVSADNVTTLEDYNSAVSSNYAV